MNVRPHVGALLFAIASVLVPGVVRADIFSPTVSYNYSEGAAFSPVVSYQFGEGIGISPVVSYSYPNRLPISPVVAYQYYEWPGNNILQSRTSPVASYSYPYAASLVTVTSPNGGEVWTAGTTKTITWSVSGNTSQINYFWTAYSVDGGVTFVNIVTASPAARSANWNIPAGISSSQVQVRVRALNAAGYILAADISDANFAVAPSGSTIRARPEIWNNAPTAGSPVTFSGATSTPSAGAVITSYTWNFGDGTFGSGATVAHTYSPQVTTPYSAWLTVEDSNGQVDTRPIWVTVTGKTLGANQEQSFSSDPVNLATGNFIYDHVDLKMPGRGLPFEFKRFYNSKDAALTSRPLGHGWTHSYNIWLTNLVSHLVVRYGDGRGETYTPAEGGGYEGEAGVHSLLGDNGNGTLTLTTKEQMRYHFAVSGAVGRLTSVADKNGNTVSLAYDGGGNLTNITDTVGRKVGLTVDGNQRITQLTDSLGRTIQYGYDGNGDLISATNARGGVTQYGYDADHQMTSATDPNGNVFVQNVYDVAQRVVTTQADALGGQTQIAYNFETRLTTVTDALGHLTYHQHDDLLRVTSITDALGNATFFEYDENNNRTKVIDKKGKATTYGYDTRGNVIYKIDPYGNSTVITYDGNNNPLVRTDALGGTTQFSYDATGNLITTVNALGLTSGAAYDAFGLPVRLTDANGNAITNAFNAQGLVALTKDPLGNPTAFTYDVVGRKLTQTNANNQVTLFSCDPNDNLVVMTDPLGHSVTNQYDANDNRIAVKDARGAVTAFHYDAKDRLVAVQDALGGITSNVFDALDRKIKTIDPRSNATVFNYDAIGNLVRVQDALSNVTHFVYDSNGNRVSQTNALGAVTAFVYDDLNRLIETTDPVGNVTRQEYDPLGRRTKLIDANSRTNSFAYDPLGRLTQLTDAAGGTVSHIYDNVGNRTATTDPNGNTTVFVYDAANRLKQRQEPIGTHLYTYDGIGNRVSHTSPNGHTIQYAYDGNNRLAQIMYPAGPPVTFGYDANGNRTDMTDALGVTVYQFDALNRTTSYTDSNGKTVGYGYDSAGNRTSLVYPGGQTVGYAYDALNRLKTVTDWHARVTTYHYDAAGNLTGTLNPNATACAYGYDAGSRLSSLTNSAPNATVIAGYRFTLDGVGNHLQTAQTEPLTPLIPNQAITYAYDADNRLTHSTGTAYSYDANGNLTSRNADTFTYDFNDCLTQAVTGTVTNQYQYDGVGNRLVRVQTGATKRYVLDVNRSLTQVLAETDAAGTVTTMYLYGLGLIAQIEPGGATAYHHYDVRGSTIALSDATGVLTDVYAYDPFGKVANQIGETPNPYRYVGRYGLADEGTGLTYIRARYYAPDMGRFITKDQLLGRDDNSQSFHRYVYAMNNPVRLVDVSGYSPRETSGVSMQLATSDPSRWNNYLISPETGGLVAGRAFTASASDAFKDTSVSKPPNKPGFFGSIFPTIWKGMLRTYDRVRGTHIADGVDAAQSAKGLYDFAQATKDSMETAPQKAKSDLDAFDNNNMTDAEFTAAQKKLYQDMIFHPAAELIKPATDIIPYY